MSVPEIVWLLYDIDEDGELDLTGVYASKENAEKARDIIFKGKKMEIESWVVI